MKAIAVAVVLVAAACDRGGGGERPPAPAPGGGPRIVTLTPSATEVVAALGAAASLVAVDDYSTYPETVKTLPRVGSFLSPNLEAIAELKPTLVIVDDIHGKSSNALEQLGIPAVACPMHTLPDVKSALTRVGAALGKAAEATAAVDAIDRALDAAAARRPAQRPRVLLIIDRVAGDVAGLVAAGPGSWLDELVAVAGGDNVLAGAGVRYPKLSREEVVRAQPDVIIDASFVAAAVTDWAALDVPAVRTGRVKVAKDAFLLAPSPRVEQALARVEELLR